MTRCSNCGSEISSDEPVCSNCGAPNPLMKEDMRKEVENYRDRRNRLIATFFLIMFGIFIFRLRNLILVLAMVSFGIVLPSTLYYAWKKRKAEERFRRFFRK